MFSMTKCKSLPKIEHFGEKEDDKWAKFLDFKNGNNLFRFISHYLFGLHLLFELELIWNLNQKLEKCLSKHQKWPFLGPFLVIVCVSAVSTPQHGQNIIIISPIPNFQAMANIWSMCDFFEIFALENGH